MRIRHENNTLMRKGDRARTPETHIKSAPNVWSTRLINHGHGLTSQWNVHCEFSASTTSTNTNDLLIDCHARSVDCRRRNVWRSSQHVVHVDSGQDYQQFSSDNNSQIEIKLRMLHTLTIKRSPHLKFVRILPGKSVLWSAACYHWHDSQVQTWLEDRYWWWRRRLLQTWLLKKVSE